MSKHRIKATVYWPVEIDHDLEIADIFDATEVNEAIFAKADHILQTTSIEGKIEGGVTINGVKMHC